jgi:hypothetical protein
MAKNKYVTMRLSEETQEYLRMMAEREQRSVSNLLGLLIHAAIREDKEKHN